MQKYYSSEKFQGTENDYAHIKTDVYPKLSFLKMFMQGSKNSVINIWLKKGSSILATAIIKTNKLNL